MGISNSIISRLQHWAAQAIQTQFALTLEPESIQVQLTNPDHEGDFTIVVFPLAQPLRKAPPIIAKELAEALMLNPDFQAVVQKVSPLAGFINCSLKAQYWLTFLNSMASTWASDTVQTTTPQRVMVEYSGPNTNKPLHMGHLRNILLGYSVCNILHYRGHHVIKANICNDRGVHICKSMYAWKLYGNGETPESSGIKGDHLVGKYYVLFQTKWKEEVAEIVASQGVKEEEAEKLAPSMQAVQKMLRDWENGDPEVLELWNMLNGWVYIGFDATYARLGVDFDHIYYESQTYLLGKEIVNEGVTSGVFYTKPDGSVWVDLTDEGLDHKLLMRGDGTAVYITQDIGTAQLRFDEYNLDRIIYVVGNEQEYHFNVLKLIFKKLGRPWWNNIYHLSYGMVELPTGKMKTREGTVVDADPLMEEMVGLAREQATQSQRNTALSDAELDQLVEMVGLGALKFFMLKSDPTKKMLFNKDESIALQGFTGPYVQYTHARIHSLLEKAGNFKADSIVETLQVYAQPLLEQELEIIKLLHSWPSTIAAAETELSPAVLINYIFDLAKSFARFYDACPPILSEPDTNARSFRLGLSSLVARQLSLASNMFGIAMPTRM